MTVGTLMSADELLRLPDDGWRHELVRGELRKMSPAGEGHGHVAAEIVASLGPYVKQRRLGRVYAAETGFRISRQPDTVRAPDAAFVRTERVVPSSKFFEGPPDIAFEVTSPGDTYSEIEEKTLDWLRAGVCAVVIIDPQTKTARIHRSADVITVADAIELDDVIPGWRLPLSELFD
jgi:Uma2 family endonuclease